MKVKEVIQAIMEKTELDPLPPQVTCDQLITGSYDMDVTGIVTTFMATVDVIRQVVSIGANLIITHEPTWFTGKDDTGWVEADPVYMQKRELIDQHNITIWRFHDHMHMEHDDGIYRGMVKEIGWEQYQVQGKKDCFVIPNTTLGELACYFKEKLNMEIIQIVGEKEMIAERIGILVGGGSLGLGSEQMPMEFMRKENLDTIVCGEILEWTLTAYIRDAQALGMNRKMLVLGHERSEEAGMKHLVEWIQSLVGGIPISFVDSKEPFQYI